jgi:hypothetical protein
MSDSSKTSSFAERFAKKESILPKSDSNSGSGSGSESSVDKYSKGKSGLSQLLEKKQNKTSGESLASDNSSADPLNSSKADLIYLVKGVDDNRNAWYYVLVERLKLSLFLKALNDDIIHLENYGKILYSAYGDEPPQGITDKLKKEYGIK